MTLEQIIALKDGPEKKFRLVKLFGAMIRAKGIDPRTLSCTEIIALVDMVRP